MLKFSKGGEEVYLNNINIILTIKYDSNDPAKPTGQ